MAATLLVCPKCSARLQPVGGNGRLLCPHCGTEAVSGPSRAALLIALGLVAFLLLAASAVVLVLAFSMGQPPKDEVANATPRQTVKADEDEPPARPDDVTPAPTGETAKESEPPKKRDALDAPPPPTSLSKEEQEEVNQAIERGVAYLKKNVPSGPMGNHRMSGLHPLVGLTLLECGVPADDPALALLARRIRAEAAQLSETYSLSLAILFLDRLGDAADETLIGRLAARLMAGQNEAGGWWYPCPALSESDGQLLLTFLDTNPLPARSGAPRDVPLVIRPDSPSRTPAGDPARPVEPLSRDKLPGSVKDLPLVKYDPKEKMPAWANDDNSNTQFAILGVWAARRHHVPVARSVARIAARFRESQNNDGSWGYNLHNGIRRDSMTCAGLLGLAVARASDGARASAEKDPAIAKGLTFLGQKVKAPGGVKPRRGRADQLIMGADSLGDMYWLWSVERVGVIYSLPTIGGKDWYAWGAGLLVAHQGNNGSWLAGQGPLVDTCFALLFLQRVNVAKDLTRQLQMLGPIRDPGLARDGK